MKPLPSSLKDGACNYWYNNDSVTLEEAAQAYGMSRATLSRALREKGLLESYVNYKSTEEIKMLQFLKSKNINNLSDLRLSNPSTII